MGPSVNIFKITPPALTAVLFRTRLLDLLEKNQAKKLILIFGQAAQGKSTLAASYAQKSKIPIAWLNLGKEESDPVNFFYLIAHSLQHLPKNAEFSSLPSRRLDMMIPAIKTLPFHEWAHSLLSRISTPLQIIIDNLHHLSHDSNSYLFLRALLDESPVHVRFIVLSREIPPSTFEYQDLKMRQEALILTNEDLAFTGAEINMYFKNIRKSTPNTDQIKEILRATGGWAGGLVLLSEGMDQLPEETITKFFSMGDLHGFKKRAFQYLGQEIFSSLSQEVQAFLIKSSIIDLIEPHFIIDFSEMQNSRDILQEHVRKNLFIESIRDERRGWLFKYHPVFRDFLKAKFETNLAINEQQLLFLKAAYLYEQREDLENALHFFLQAHAYSQAANVIERLGMDALRMGRIQDLGQWVRSFPDEIVKANPWLLLYRAMTFRFVSGRENVANFQAAYALFKQKSDLRGTIIGLAQLIIASVRSGYHPIPLDHLLGEGENLLRSANQQEFIYELAMLWIYVGVGHILSEGNVRRGINACQNAYLIAKQIGDVNLQVFSMIYLIGGFTFVGEFEEAENYVGRVRKRIQNTTHSELQFLYYFLDCVLANHQGSFSKMEDLIDKLRVEIERFGLVSMSPWTYELLSSLKLGQGALEEAEEVANEYRLSTTTLENPFFEGMALRMLALVLLHQGLYDRGKEIAEEAMTIFSKGSPSRLEVFRVKSILGLLCIQLKDYQRAEREIDEALHYCESISSHIWVAENHLAKALLHGAQARQERAALSLQRGFGIARSKKYEHFFILGQRYLLDACLLALRLKVKDITDYASSLLVRRLGSLAQEKLQAWLHDPDPDLREKALALLREIHRSRKPTLRIESLGGFRIFRGETEIKEKDWIRNQPKQLLMAIVSHGNRKITKDMLVDDLWPDADPTAGESSLKAALYYLRKSLEPELNKDFGSSYVHLHDNLIFLDPDLCRVDTEQFLSAMREGEKSEKKGNDKKTLGAYAEAAEIYRGDFLPEESYGPWADLRRDELRWTYIDLLGRAARLYERQGRLKRAIDCHNRIIQADPLLEESYQKLMTLYSNHGMVNEALRTYGGCKKALKSGLKTKPDTQTTAIYKKILEKTLSD